MKGRRLQPEVRRQHILDAACELLSERPYTTVTTADVAEAAGVARSLVHHYFGGMREVFLAVIADRGGALSDVRTAGIETPFDERIAHNIAAALDVIAANRATWLAVAGHGDAITDPHLRELVETTVQRNIQRTLDVNADVLEDTPAARLALRCHYAFSTTATRAWLTGAATRAETEKLLITASRDLLRHTIPALQR